MIPPKPTTLCWLWFEPNTPKGYVQIYRDGRMRRAHRWYYEQAFGLIPVGLEIDHLCNVRACVNPWHLEAVTQAENIRRSVVRRVRRTAPKCGHFYGPTVLRANGYKARWCPICQRESVLKSKANAQRERQLDARVSA